MTTDLPPFETTFAVPMHCDSCVQDVSAALHKVNGVQSITPDLSAQLLAITGTAPPSAIVAAIQSTGRDAILRGSGRSTDGSTAAVCILETHAPGVKDPVRGLIRMVQVASQRSVLDITVRGVASGSYAVTVRERGDISAGAKSTGDIWGAVEGSKAEEKGARGDFGTVEVDQSGLGSVFLDRPVPIWEILGRSMVVSRRRQDFDPADPDTLVGVVARSAGVWDNDKTVCSCSGKTVWEERAEQTKKGML